MHVVETNNYLSLQCDLSLQRVIPYHFDMRQAVF